MNESILVPDSLNTIIPLELLDEWNNQKETIRKKHIEVSNLITPKNEIFQKMNLDYVKLRYMRRVADKYWPGWSWKIVNSYSLGDHAFVVHGRLEFFDGLLKRTGDMVAAHRIQQKKDSPEYVDVGNDIKSANTDCLKKAFNVYMNIADDVYKNLDPEEELERLKINDEQRKEILKYAMILGNEELMKEMIEDYRINSNNVSGSIARLKRQSEEKQKKDDLS